MTAVRGDTARVFAALRQGFEDAARLGPLAMTVTVSDACPTDAA